MDVHEAINLLKKYQNNQEDALGGKNVALGIIIGAQLIAEKMEANQEFINTMTDYFKDLQETTKQMLKDEEPWKQSLDDEEDKQ